MKDAFAEITFHTRQMREDMNRIVAEFDMAAAERRVAQQVAP